MKILTSPSSFGQVGDKPFDLLRENGYEIINNPYGRKLTEDEVIELAADCVGIVAGVETLSKKVMDALPKLKCISRVGVGMDSVDIEYATKKGIVVVNTPDGPTRGVAELTLAMTFALLRKIPQADSDMKNKVWKKQIGNLIQDKIVGVIGLGRIGRKVSEFFTGIGNTVIGCDPYPDAEWCRSQNVSLYDLETLLAKADIITLHAPGNADKTPMIGQKELDIIRPTSFLINISRGGIVDEQALYDALRSHKLAGAAVDVFSVEPYTGALCELENIILTPHLGSYAEEGKLNMEIDAVKNLIEKLNTTNEA
ncbi:phosphoglycerate dehydrogenase [Mucilaginibacter mali]|uniref:Phosphoglycerate dehydrogenase n=1 Tax=Mucilaginibacter mali TaxID=2740462 RepID=A0A7D4TYN1_9SPHI|nr:phosphoglycerate dehydrogenase [Mucilaginibacter mali]QKJ31477.1 phosphoglycerate dehydrogenase [Mucilaginibacter mali]